MTTQPKDLMTLEDVIKGIETLRLHECGSSNRAVANLCDAALHHLDAGRKECECGLTLNSITHHSHGIHIMGGVPRLAAKPITFCPWCGGTVAHLAKMFSPSTPTAQEVKG